MKSLRILVLALLLSAPAAMAQYDKDVFSFRGRLALQEGRLSDALTQFNILAQIDTTDHWTFFYRGIVKYNLGDIRGAKADFDTSVRLNPIFTSGYHYRAIAESRGGDYDAALEDLQMAISLRPGLSGLYFTRGVTFFLSQQFQEAVSDFDRYIRSEPRDPSAYLNRGASYLFMGDTLRAMTDYDKAIQLDRFEPEGYIRRGRLLAARGDMDAALSDLNRAIQLDSTNTLAYFNRAILNAESDRVREAMADLDKVLQYEPGNALTLYNRSLLSAQLGDFESALADMDRVISINPSNVLAYFNRAGFFVSMERWDDALADYNKAIELFPDFAKAYMNRSWVELQMGMRRASREDYLTAQRKVAEYHASSVEGAEFADTTRRFNALLALDADFARHGFNNEMLQYRDVDINLKPLYKFILTDTRDATNYALRHRYENPLLEQFLDNMPVPVAIVPVGTASEAPDSLVLPVNLSPGMRSFLQALADVEAHHYTAALEHYDRATSASVADDTYARFYRGFYLMNRAVLRAEMIDFIASFESNVQTLTMDDRGSVRARVREQVSRQYDYSQAVEDMEAAAEALPGIPYIHFNLANLYCLSSRLVEAIDEYEKAIRLYPWMGEAYFNRGLVLIYLKDKEKGCIDLSRAGELGVGDAYSVISRYCDEDSGL